MGKGDQKTRRGKLFSGSFGVLRPRKKERAFSVLTTTKKSVAEPEKSKVIPKPKAAPKPKEEPVAEEVKPVEETKTPVAKKPAAKKEPVTEEPPKEEA